MRVLTLLLAFLFGSAFAGTITVTGYGDIAVQTDSCADAIYGFSMNRKSAGTSGRGVGCSDDPVVAGAWILVTNGALSTTDQQMVWRPVTAVNAPSGHTLSSLSAAVGELQTMVGSLGSSVGDFDYVKAAGIFSFFFSFIVGVWFFAKNIGVVINSVRKL